MKYILKTFRISFFLVITFSLGVSCIDVINVDLPEPSDRVIFNANIIVSGDIQKDSTQTFYLTQLAGINEDVKPIIGASIEVIDNLGNSYFFLEDTPGNYICNNFFLSPTATKFSLNAVINNETYKATEQIIYTPPIDSAEIYLRSDESNIELTWVHLYFQDTPNEPNRYEMRYFINGILEDPSNSWGIIDDRFQDGKVIEGNIVINKDNAEPGDTINLMLSSISQTNYNFASTLISQSYQASPFAPAPSSIRGNIWNSNDKNHYPLGYFRINHYSYLDLYYTKK